MTITEQFKAKRCVFSIECFPPKQTTQMDKLKDTLRQLQRVLLLTLIQRLFHHLVTQTFRGFVKTEHSALAAPGAGLPA